MAKTVLQLLQEIANELGIDEPKSLVNTRHRLTKQLLANLYRAAQIARDKVAFSELNKTLIVPLVAGQSQYKFPSDFDYELFDTHYDSNDKQKVYGPITPQEWQQYKFGYLTTLPFSRYRVKGYKCRKLTVSPTPSQTHANNFIVLEYQSKQWILPPEWEANKTYFSGAYVNYGNNVYKYKNSESNRTSGTTPPTHESGTASDGSIDWILSEDSYDRVMTNDDIFLLPEQVLSIGTQMLWRARKSLPFQIESGLFQSTLDRAKVNSLSAGELYLDGCRRQETGLSSNVVSASQTIAPQPIIEDEVVEQEVVEEPVVEDVTEDNSTGDNEETEDEGTVEDTTNESEDSDNQEAQDATTLPVDACNIIIEPSFAETFAGGAFDPDYWSLIGVETRHNDSFYTPNTSAPKFGLPPGQTSTPDGNSHALHYYMPEGTPTEQTPAQVTWAGDEYTERLWHWKEWYSSPFAWADGQKLFRANHRSGATTKKLSLDINFGGNLWNVNWDEGQAISNNFSANVSNPEPKTLTDQWVDYKVYFKQPSEVNLTDGRLIFWVKDVKVYDQNISMRDSEKFDGFWIGGNSSWNGDETGSVTVTPELSRWIADIKVYDIFPCEIAGENNDSTPTDPSSNDSSTNDTETTSEELDVANLIAETNFNDNGVGIFDPNMWDSIGTDTRFTESFYTQEPKLSLPAGVSNEQAGGSDFGAHYYIPQGSPSDSYGFYLYRQGEYSERYWSWKEYFKSPFPWADGQKIFRFGQNSGNTTKQGAIDIDFAGERLHFFWDEGGGGSNQESEFVMHPDAVNNWNEVEDRIINFDVYFKMPSAIGANDGRLAFWLDKNLMINKYIDMVDDDVFNFSWIGGNSSWNGNSTGSTVTSAEMHRYIIGKVQLFSGLPSNVTLPNP